MQRLELERRTIFSFFVFVAFLAPFVTLKEFQLLTRSLGATTQVFVSAGLAGVAFIYVVLELWRGRQVAMSKTVVLAAGFFFGPQLLAAVGAVFFSVFKGDAQYSYLIASEVGLRCINVAIYFAIYLAGSAWLISTRQEHKILFVKAYYLGLSVLLFTCFWQLASYHSAIWFPSIDVRNRFHGLGQYSPILFRNRVTGFTGEPSYLSPYLIDFIVLSFVIFRKKVPEFVAASLAAMALLFSFSLGGIVNLAAVVGLCVMFIVLRDRRLPRKMSSRISAFFPALIVLLVGTVIGARPALEIITNRIVTTIDSASNGRLYMIVMPLQWFTEDGPLPALIGHGPGSFAFLGVSKVLPSDGKPVHVTSHMIFSDFLYETGLIGVVCLTLFFATLQVSALRGASRSKSRASLVAFFLVTHLTISEFYRGGYMGPRFWIVMLVITALLDPRGWDEAPSLLPSKPSLRLRGLLPMARKLRE